MMGEAKLFSLDLERRERAQKRDAELLLREAQRVGHSIVSSGEASHTGTVDHSIAELVQEALQALRVFNANPGQFEQALKVLLRPSELRDIAQLLGRWASERDVLAQVEALSATRAACNAARLDVDEGSCEILARHGVVDHLQMLRTMIDKRMGRDVHATLRASTSEEDRVSVHIEGKVTDAKLKRLARLTDDWIDAPDDAWKIISIYPT